MRRSQGFRLYEQDEVPKERLARAMVRVVVAMTIAVMEMDNPAGDGGDYAACGRRKRWR